MFFYLSKILSLLLFPYPLFLLFSLIAIFRLKKSRFRPLYGLAWLSITVFSTTAMGDTLLRSLEDAHSRPSSAEIAGADAIIVLSGMVNPLAMSGSGGARPGGAIFIPEMTGGVDRILLGEEFLRRGRAPVLMISGGTGLMMQRGRSEAELLRDWLIGRGLSRERVLAEAGSRNTAENARESAKIARERGWKKIILITSAFHMRRAQLCFRRTGLETIPYPADYRANRIPPGPEAYFPTTAGIIKSTIAIKEYLGLVAYRVRGYI